MYKNNKNNMWKDKGTKISIINCIIIMIVLLIISIVVMVYEHPK